MSDNKARIRRRMSLQDAKAKPLTEADVSGRAAGVVVVGGAAVVRVVAPVVVVLVGPDADLVVRKLAGRVQRAVAVPLGFGDDGGALGECAHGVDVGADGAVPRCDAGVRDVVLAISRVELHAAEHRGLLRVAGVAHPGAAHLPAGLEVRVQVLQRIGARADGPFFFRRVVRNLPFFCRLW